MLSISVTFYSSVTTRQLWVTHARRYEMHIASKFYATVEPYSADKLQINHW